MKKTGFMAVVVAALCFAAAANASAQLLLNEVNVNPGGTDGPCEYVELRGTPGAIVENVHFVSLEGDTNKGQATFVITFGVPGPAIGSNGLLVVVGAAPCGSRTYPAGTTVLATSSLDIAAGALQNGSNSFLLISSATAIAPSTDLDTNDDGVLELPAGATVLDSIAWTDGGAGDVLYGAVVTAFGGTIGAATRFPGNNSPNLASAWYAGAMTGTQDALTYSATIRTGNFPENGALTPGAPNVGEAPPDSPVDMNGDGLTDYSVVRAAGGAGSLLTWHTQFNGGSPYSPREWGVSGDQILSGDYDGDGMDDIAVYRPSNGTFYVLHSGPLTMRVDQFGQAGDNPRVVGDYDGDGRDDLALYRPGAQGTWFYKTSQTALFTSVNWGQTGDVPAPGDYDGDGRADFVVRRADGANGRFFKNLSTAGQSDEVFGLATDSVVPGDYDGDGRTDVAVLRTSGGFYVWDFEPSGTAGSTVVSDTWGIPGDVVAQGDYDGDGQTDYTVWRPGAPGIFYTMTVGDRRIFHKEWGVTGDQPVAAYNTF